jgi:leukotriene-A4 hydrolase
VNGRDIHSHARPDEARVVHLSLDASLDVEARRLRGRATLRIEASPGAEAVTLDTRDLRIVAISDGSGAALPFTLGDPDPVFGRALRVTLPDGEPVVAVDYETEPGSPGLHWLAAEQTAGGRIPFVFSQGHAILTRSWIPTQDSVAVRQSYDARITVPEGMTAVMSAEHLTPDGVPADGERCFGFRLREPIPPYLIALAAGDIGFRPVGARTGIFAERALLDRAAWEFAEMERMLEEAERIAGPYRWGRADLLVLPPAFPFGGMENPRLIYVSPTLLAGDRSLTTVVAHELAHAWAGNLFTPATWSDFWLNEGFTVYLELRIQEALQGAERAAMLEVYGHREWEAAVQRLGADAPDTRLRLDLAGRDPGDAVTVVPYVKGAALLRVIEAEVGRERFTSYLRGWFERAAFRSVTTAEWVADLREHLLAGDAGLEARIGLRRWLDEPGVPENRVVPRSVVLEAVEHEAERFGSGTAAARLATDGWRAQEWRHFLTAIRTPLPGNRLRELGDAFRFAASANAEVLFAWLRLAVRSHHDPAIPDIERFLTSCGRAKFVRPLFAALVESAWGRPHAERIFGRARPLYHAALAAALEGIVGG